MSFDDPISGYLSESILDGLHTIDGTDYTDDIRIRHLLGHTSGLPHSLPEGGKVFLNTRLEESPEGKTLFDEMVEEPDRIWEPEETIEWAKQNLEPHVPPGEDCYYSEFGYNLLGLIVESITEQPYHEALAGFLFDPLEMEQSYLPPFADPAVESELPTAPFYIDETRIDVDDVGSLSAFYAGGQTVNTAEELFRFHRSLVEGELVAEGTLQEMQQWKNCGRESTTATASSASARCRFSNASTRGAGRVRAVRS